MNTKDQLKKLREDYDTLFRFYSLLINRICTLEKIFVKVGKVIDDKDKWDGIYE